MDLDILPQDRTNPPCPPHMDPEWYADYRRRNRLAYAGIQAHDYCHGPNCQSCGCSDIGPCVSHEAGPKNIPNPNFIARVG